MGNGVHKRARVVEGSCWYCKKRRIKCDLSKPQCHRCRQEGRACNYNERLIRWSKKPVTSVPVAYQISRLEAQLNAHIDARDQRSLDYFQVRVWPLLSTVLHPCSSPLLLALKSRVVMLATCMLAGSHHLLQDGRAKRTSLDVQRVECLSLLRLEVDEWSSRPSGNKSALIELLFAVILLYLHDGFLEWETRSVFTASHHKGVLAIIEQAGGIHKVLDQAQDTLHMLLSEFATTDLTAAMLNGTPPSFPPHLWEVIDQGAVWYGRDPPGRCSLASVFRNMSDMAFYFNAISSGQQELSMAQVRLFESKLYPVYIPLSIEDLGAGRQAKDEKPITMIYKSEGRDSSEAVRIFSLVRAFQHSALIYLYRAICGLAVAHPIVQQHVESCLNAVFAVPQQSKEFNCIIYPLAVAGAHTRTQSGRQAVLQLVDTIYDTMRFFSIQAVKLSLKDIWDKDAQNDSWIETFANLSSHVLVL